MEERIEFSYFPIEEDNGIRDFESRTEEIVSISKVDGVFIIGRILFDAHAVAPMLLFYWFEVQN